MITLSGYDILKSIILQFFNIQINIMQIVFYSSQLQNHCRGTYYVIETPRLTKIHNQKTINSLKVRSKSEPIQNEFDSNIGIRLFKRRYS